MILEVYDDFHFGQEQFYVKDFYKRFSNMRKYTVFLEFEWYKNRKTGKIQKRLIIKDCK